MLRCPYVQLRVDEYARLCFFISSQRIHATCMPICRRYRATSRSCDETANVNRELRCNPLDERCTHFQKFTILRDRYRLAFTSRLRHLWPSLHAREKKGFLNARPVKYETCISEIETNVENVLIERERKTFNRIFYKDDRDSWKYTIRNLEDFYEEWRVGHFYRVLVSAIILASKEC